MLNLIFMVGFSDFPCLHYVWLDLAIIVGIRQDRESLFLKTIRKGRAGS